MSGPDGDDRTKTLAPTRRRKEGEITPKNLFGLPLLLLPLTHTQLVIDSYTRAREGDWQHTAETEAASGLCLSRSGNQFLRC